MFGLRYSVTVFFMPLQKEFGWTSAMTAGSVTAFFWIYGVAALFLDRLYRSLGVRKIVFLGGILLGVGGILCSFASELWHLYASWGILAAVGSSILYTVPTMVLGRFFEKHRGKAVGWSSIGVSIGQAALVPFAAWIIANFGWRPAYITLSSLVMAGVAVPGYFIFRENPESLGLKKDGGNLTREEEEQTSQVQRTEGWKTSDALRNRSLILILVSYFFLVGTTISMLTFVVPHIIRLGVDPLLASTAMGVIGFMSAIGSFMFGLVSDWMGRKYTIAMLSAGIATAMFVSTIIPPDMIALYAWVTLYGLTYGGAPEQYAAIVTDYFGARKDIGLFGYVMFAGAMGGGLFPLIGGYLSDMTGSYYASLTYLGVGMVCSTITILLAKPPKAPESSR
jgi:MFS family permease